MTTARITRPHNNLSSRKLKEIAADPMRSNLEKAIARKILLMRGETVTL